MRSFDGLGMTRDEATHLIVGCMQAVMEADGVKPARAVIDANTRLIGKGSPLDSLALVNVLLDLEQEVHGRVGVGVTLTSEQAFSRSQSPYRNVQTLADYLLELIQETSGP
jgi:acyl carrier protein